MHRAKQLDARVRGLMRSLETLPSR